MAYNRDTGQSYTKDGAMEDFVDRYAAFCGFYWIIGTACTVPGQVSQEMVVSLGMATEQHCRIFLEFLSITAAMAAYLVIDRTTTCPHQLTQSLLSTSPCTLFCWYFSWCISTKCISILIEANKVDSNNHYLNLRALPVGACDCVWNVRRK